MSEKQTKLSEHIAKSIIQPISEKSVAHSFTTEPKKHPRKGQYVVRDRCLEFIAILKERGYTVEIPLEEAKILFQREMGIMDRASLKAYFGSQPSRNVRKIQRIARYATGITSLKTIELSQDIPEKKGYLELLGLASFLRKGQTWFLMLQHEPLIAELGSHICEGSGVSKDGFSLTSKLQAEGCEKKRVVSSLDTR